MEGKPSHFSRVVLAGVCSGLFFATPYFIGFYGLMSLFTPLPLIMIGLGFGGFQNVLKASLIALTILVLIKFNICFHYFVEYALPCSALTYLALQSKVSSDGTVWWRPETSVLLWLSGFSLFICLIFGLEFNAKAFVEKISSEAFYLNNIYGSEPTSTQLKYAFYLFSPILGGTKAFTWSLLMVFNLWLAQRFLASKQLLRSKMQLKLIRLPNACKAIFPASLLLMVLLFPNGAWGVVANIVVISAFLILINGMAVMSYVFEGKSRGFIFLISLFIVIFAWPITIIMGLGMADGFFDVRGQLRKFLN